MVTFVGFYLKIHQLMWLPYDVNESVFRLHDTSSDRMLDGLELLQALSHGVDSYITRMQDKNTPLDGEKISELYGNIASMLRPYLTLILCYAPTLKGRENTNPHWEFKTLQNSSFICINLIHQHLYLYYFILHVKDKIAPLVDPGAPIHSTQFTWVSTCPYCSFYPYYSMLK